MGELTDGMYLNTVVIVTNFVGRVMLSLLINDFVFTAIVKRVVLIVVNEVYKSS